MTLRLWGSEQLVNTTSTGAQISPVTAALSNGGYVIAWNDFGPATVVARFQIYDASGNPVGTEKTVPLSDAGGNQILSSIAALADGGFVIGIADNDSPTDNDSIGATFSADGTFGLFVTFDASSEDTGGPLVVGASTGTAAGAAYDLGTSGVGDGIDAVYKGFFGSSIFVNVIRAGDQTVAGIDHNKSTEQTAILFNNGASSVNVRVYDEPSNTFLDVPFVVNTASFSIVSGTDIDFLASGNLLVTHTESAALVNNTYLSVFSVFGSNLGTTVLKNANEVAVTSLRNGYSAVTYSENTTPDVKLFLLDASGMRIGLDIIVNQDSGGSNILPDITELADGRLLLTWETLDNSYDGSSTAILSQIIDPRDGMVTGTNAAETLIGHNTVNDELRGFGGNDTLNGLGGMDAAYGGDGNDTLNGGKGDDDLYGGRGNDALSGGNGDDELFGEAGNDTLRGGNGADALNGGSGAADLAEYITASSGVQVALDGSLTATGEALGDTFIGIERLRGSNFADTLRGDGNNNLLIGETGNDTLQGQGGNDTLRGGTGADTMTGGTGTDVFQYLALADAGDAITDFTAVNDNFQFAAAAFGGLPVGALGVNRFQSSLDNVALTNGIRFIYETDARILWFDADGSGGGAAVRIATLQAGATLTNADILII